MTFILGAPNGQSINRVRVRPVVAAGVWELGAALLINAAGEWAECGADPALIGGFSEHAVGTGSGALYPVGTKEFPPGKCIASLAEGNIFSADYVGTLPANAGGSYGIVKGADGLWRVDFAETVNTRVLLVSIDEELAPTNRHRVQIRVLPANVQIVE